MLLIPKTTNYLVHESYSNVCRVKLLAHNWKNDYPYFPEVEVSLWHDGSNLYLHFDVVEDYILANISQDGGEVWTDSCVEFFFNFGEDGYYNIESNCIGKIVLTHRLGKEDGVETMPYDLFHYIKRYASLGKTNFGLKQVTEPWHLTLTIPAKSFFKHNIYNLSGVKGKCNIYKCGDNLPNPHFISLSPITTPTPDFHRPEFFEEFCFE